MGNALPPVSTLPTFSWKKFLMATILPILWIGIVILCNNYFQTSFKIFFTGLDLGNSMFLNIFLIGLFGPFCGGLICTSFFQIKRISYPMMINVIIALLLPIFFILSKGPLEYSFIENPLLQIIQLFLFLFISFTIGIIAGWLLAKLSSKAVLGLIGILIVPFLLMSGHGFITQTTQDPTAIYMDQSKIKPGNRYYPEILEVSFKWGVTREKAISFINENNGENLTPEWKTWNDIGLNTLTVRFKEANEDYLLEDLIKKIQVNKEVVNLVMPIWPGKGE